jgi:hypothetical protein
MSSAAIVAIFLLEGAVSSDRAWERQGSGVLSPGQSGLPPGNNRRCLKWVGMQHAQFR